MSQTDPTNGAARSVGFTLTRALLLGAGFVCLGLGIVGILLPLLPTTPFLLLSAACFARSSPRFYRRLLRNRVVGPPIREWRRSRTISRRTKVVAITVLLLVIGYAGIWCVPTLPAQLALGTVAVLVTVFLLRIPSRP